MSFTIALIKPDVSSDDAIVTEIIWQIIKRGFDVQESRKLQLTRAQAEQFYAEHRSRPFFAALTEFMTSGPIYALKVVYLQDPAQSVNQWREAIGATDSSTPGSIRQMFGNPHLTRSNAVHGSDSDEAAAREYAFFFEVI